MLKFLYFIPSLLSFFFLPHHSNSQYYPKTSIEFCKSSDLGSFITSPTKIWDRNYSGGPITTINQGGNSILSGSDELVKMISNSDDTYTLFGISNSIQGNSKTENFVSNFCSKDFWIVKVDKLGNKIWDRTYGGEFQDIVLSASKCSDGSYIILGLTNSPQGYDVSQTYLYGSYSDIWILKIDPNGNKIWDKRIGSKFNNWANDIFVTEDNGFLIAASSEDDIGFDKTHSSKGGNDMWLLKFDSNGNKIWDKVFGGSASDYLVSISKANDGFLLAGFTNSPISGDVSIDGRGSNDFWVVKIDNNGNKIWDKRYGGTNNDFLRKSLKVQGGYLLGGETLSPISGDKTSASGSANNQEMWMIKIDEFGNKLWDRTFGNGGSDYLSVLALYNDSTYLVGGRYNLVYGAKEDYYINKVTKNGELKWEKLIGSSFDDKLVDVGFTKSEGIILAGTTIGSLSNDNDRTSGATLSDYWLVKLSTCISANNPLIINNGDFVNIKLTSPNSCNYENVIWSNNKTGNIIEDLPSQVTEYSAKCFNPLTQSFDIESNKLTVYVNCGPNQNIVEPINNTLNSLISIKAENTINAANKIYGIGVEVLFQANNSIILYPGFEAKSEIVFKAQIDNCLN